MGLDALRNNGVEHIIAVPGMLFAATHAKNDIPSVLVTYQKKYPNLKAIMSLGAGVDHITSDPELPEGIPIVRLVDKKLTHEMCLHALHWVLHFHSDQHLYRSQQLKRQWIQQSSIQTEDRTIGIMGLGNIGRSIGELLVTQSFNVIGSYECNIHATGFGKQNG